MSGHRIGLVADTHIPEAGPDLPAEAYAVLAGCEWILHCGDLHTIAVLDRLERLAPTIASRGNGDTFEPRVRRPGVPQDARVVDVAVVEIGGLHVGLTHDLSHLEYRNDDDVASLLHRCFGRRVDIALFGHTHVPMVRGLADGTALVNPGSPTMPYGYLDLVGTVGLLDIDGGHFEVTILDLHSGKPQLRLRGPGPHTCEVGPRPSSGR